MQSVRKTLDSAEEAQRLFVLHRAKLVEMGPGNAEAVV